MKVELAMAVAFAAGTLASHTMKQGKQKHSAVLPDVFCPQFCRNLSNKLFGKRDKRDTSMAHRVACLLCKDDKPAGPPEGFAVGAGGGGAGGGGAGGIGLGGDGPGGDGSGGDGSGGDGSGDRGLEGAEAEGTGPGGAPGIGGSQDGPSGGSGASQGGDSQGSKSESEGPGGGKIGGGRLGGGGSGDDRSKVEFGSTSSDYASESGSSFTGALDAGDENQSGSLGPDVNEILSERKGKGAGNGGLGFSEYNVYPGRPPRGSSRKGRGRRYRWVQRRPRYRTTYTCRYNNRDRY